MSVDVRRFPTDTAVEAYTSDEIDALIAALAGVYLKLDCSNDPLTSGLDILGYVQSRLGGGNYARLSHDGTYAVLGTNAGGVFLNVGGPNDIVLRMGDAAGANRVYFWDNANATVASVDSNGVIRGLDLHASNSVYTAYLLDNFALGAMDMTGDPWYLGGVSLELSDSLEVNGLGLFDGSGGLAVKMVNHSEINAGKRLYFDGA